MINIAVLGTGSIGERYLRIIPSLEGVSPIAIPKHRNRVTELAARGLTVAPNLEEAAALGAKLAIIATETGLHLQDGLEAMDLGMDLLVEKPLAATRNQARELQKRAQLVGRQLYVGCVLRFSESLNTFRTLIGQLGQLHSVRIECQSYLPDWQPDRAYGESFRSRPGEGGVLLDLIHEIDYAGWLYGWPKAIQARVQNLGRLQIDADEAAHIYWETSNGCAISVTVDFLSRPSKRQMSAYGEHGTLVWDGIEGLVSLALDGNSFRTITSYSTTDEMFKNQIAAFLKIGASSDLFPASAEDGIKALAVCDAARKASESKREQTVAYL